MRVRQIRVLGVIAILFLSSTLAMAQQSSTTPPRESKVGRTVGLVAGLAGGLMLGWAISDDDAVEAEKKLARNIAITTGACAVAGFFAGRAIDKKRSYQVPMDPADQARITDRLLESEMEKWGFSKVPKGELPTTVDSN